MRLIQATKREIDMSNRKRTPGDSGADTAVSPSGKCDKSDVKIIPADRLERARAKKYGYPYDPARDAWTKSYVKWKRENARPEPRGPQSRTSRSRAARKKVTPPETPDVKKPVKLRIVGRDGYTVADFYRDFPGAGISLPGRIAADLAKQAAPAPSSERPFGEPGPESQQDPSSAKP
jgi:hypothetical protein